jgi:hypothetical protein
MNDTNIKNFNLHDLQMRSFRSNQVESVVSYSKQAGNSVTMTLAAVATGGGTLFILVDGMTLSYTTVGLYTSAASAIAASADWQLDADAFYNGEYLVAPSGSTITVSKVSGDPISVSLADSSDATQTLNITSGYVYEAALLYEQTVAASGIPARFEDGFAFSSDILTSSRESLLTVKTQLNNSTGGSISARYRLWYWFDFIGWVVDAEVGIRTITETTGSSVLVDAITVAVVGAKKVAVELVDNNAAGNLTLGSSLSSWVILSN